jgi:hypothetical protein
VAKKELESLWTALAEADAIKAYRAIVTLESVPEQSVPLLAKRLRLPAPDAQRLHRLLARLDSEDFADRERATEELRKLGWLAEPALRAFLEGKPSLEARKRARELLESAGKAELSPDALRVVRGMEVLERIGNAAAKRTLRTLADSTSEGRLSREARAALQRLDKRLTAKP